MMAFNHSSADDRMIVGMSDAIGFVKGMLARTDGLRLPRAEMVFMTALKACLPNGTCTRAKVQLPW